MINTAQKINLAKIAYRLIMIINGIFGRSSVVEVRRGGINWHLDLKEGIDFSIYILGGFEPSTLKLYKKLVKPGSIVLDIGANVGSHTLPLSDLVGSSGQVVAFEPTHFAFQKLKENIKLNPHLASRISTQQMMLCARIDDNLETNLYSSWPLDTNKDLHEKHKGRLMTTTGASVCTLDQAVEDMGLNKVDFIKLDVDGHEYLVISGGMDTIRRYNPVILMELAPYLFKENFECFDKLIKFFRESDYCFFDADTGDLLPNDAAQLMSLVPDGASRNVIIKNK